MNSHVSKFRYRLDALIKLRASERDVLKEEVQRALAEVERKTRERDDAGAAIGRAEEELRVLCRDGAQLSMDAQLRLQLYLRQQREMCRTKQLEVNEASSVAVATIGRLQIKLRDAKSLESHRKRKRRQFDENEQRMAMNVADEQWLRGRRALKK